MNALPSGQIESGGLVRDERIACRSFEARDHGVARRVREVHVEAAARCVVGWKRQAEKPLLTAGDDLGRGERQKIGRLQHAVDDNSNPSTLLDNVLNGGVGWISMKASGDDRPEM